MHSFPTRLLELTSSMRFAVSLLTVVAIASVAGTVMKQGEPYVNYLNQFGPFWFRAFEYSGLYAVYNAPWFVLIMAFLVISVSVCLYRNAPWMVREMSNFRVARREDSLRLLPQHAELRFSGAPQDALRAAAGYLERNGFSVKVEEARLAAKAGSANRLGYLAAHTAIVAICIGGLLDSNLPLQASLWLGDKRPVEGNLPLSQVPASARLPVDSLSFRGSVFLAEGQAADIAVLNFGDGILVQELPYRIALKKFHIEHYSTGQPKLFASDVVVTDKQSGKSFETRIEVNKPLVHGGIAAYQASFDDGGTRVRLAGHHLLAPGARTLDFDGRIGDTLEMKYAGDSYRLELTGFRAFNIENVAEGEAKREMRNVGPSVTYKLRDPAGQAREYHNYMAPMRLDGRWVYLTGMRETPSESFRYLRVPVDEQSGLDGYWMLRRELLEEKSRRAIAERFARASITAQPPSNAALRLRLTESAERVLATFSRNGFQGVAEFLEGAVPEPEREQAAEIYMRVLQGAAWEAWQYARARARLPVLEPTPERARFVQDSLNALSDSFHYGVPVYLALAEYDEVKASVLQLTRSPGRDLVYLGCALLILGVFALLYVRERRVWLLLKADGAAVLGAACNRRTLDFDREFARLRDALERLLKNGTG